MSTTDPSGNSYGYPANLVTVQPPYQPDPNTITEIEWVFNKNLLKWIILQGKCFFEGGEKRRKKRFVLRNMELLYNFLRTRYCRVSPRWKLTRLISQFQKKEGEAQGETRRQRGRSWSIIGKILYSLLQMFLLYWLFPYTYPPRVEMI